MRRFCLAASVIAWASAISVAHAADPCAAAAPSYGNNPIVGLFNQISQQRRSQACVAERQAQWAEYNAHQKAIQDKAAADAAQQKQQAQTLADATRAQQDARHVQVTHEKLASAARTEHKRAQARVAARREEQDADTRRRDDYVRLVRDEGSPDNVCRDPKLAKAVMQGWDGLDLMKDSATHVIDIEHVTTLYFHTSDRSYSCHGVFVTSHGSRVVGTATLRKNIAGDPVFVWERDANQDVSRYVPPAGVAVPGLVVTKVLDTAPM